MKLFNYLTYKTKIKPTQKLQFFIHLYEALKMNRREQTTVGIEKQIKKLAREFFT